MTLRTLSLSLPLPLPLPLSLFPLFLVAVWCCSTSASDGRADIITASSWIPFFLWWNTMHCILCHSGKLVSGKSIQGANHHPLHHLQVLLQDNLSIKALSPHQKKKKKKFVNQPQIANHLPFIWSTVPRVSVLVKARGYQKSSSATVPVFIKMQTRGVKTHVRVPYNRNQNPHGRRATWLLNLDSSGTKSTISYTKQQATLTDPDWPIFYEETAGWSLATFHQVRKSVYHRKVPCSSLAV